MPRLSWFLAAAPLCAALAFAQTPAGGTKHRAAQSRAKATQSLTGILVDAECSAANIPAASLRITTGTASRSAAGQRDRPAASNSSGSPARHNNTNAAGEQPRDVNHVTGVDAIWDRTETSTATRTTNEPASVIDEQSDAAKGNSADRAASPPTAATNNIERSKGWDKSCFISPSTHSFVLMLEDGRKLRLDSASDRLVAERLESGDRLQEANKIFRVRVHGSVDGDSIHVTDIQM